ncbi:MAG: alpha amylase C-terminal domain-containing protein [Bacteroidales bacterium]|nr:alpha amylase C-terminal domain-containing protein [Candidatus Cacconaster merdequi]
MGRIKKIYDLDPWLTPYKDVIERRNRTIIERAGEMAGDSGSLAGAVNGHLYYSPHREGSGYVFREWAPNASRIYVIGDFNGWQRSADWEMKPLGGGDWELVADGSRISHCDLFKWYVEWPGGGGERLPAYATRCVQDPETKIFAAQVWEPEKPYLWRSRRKIKVRNPLIYEVHIGMSSEEGKVASFTEFRRNVLPRVKDLGYNTLQIMALQEHPYYGSFGYQVSNLFALSSRFGTPEEFKELVDDAHRAGIAVIMDIVHSHAVANEAEGLSRLDGSYTTYFHEGDRGWHPAWKSRCFDYGKDSTVHFLLSNLKYWMEEYRLDGFRFDGVTSMLYLDHGLERDFNGYDDYFNGGQDEDAITYLGLANILVKELNPRSLTIAEDMSGMAGLAAPLKKGGIGFDFRMSMGVADHWIKWIKERSDWDWSMGEVFYELSGKRKDERTVSYAECHDQALVGDKTLIFRLMDKEMYYSMSKDSRNLTVERGIALHKMIRMATIATAGDGYLTFMGNEFGHPEWIDFPREGNGWSYKYARRQWSLADNPSLRYGQLLAFDKGMISLFADNEIFKSQVECLRADELKKVLVIGRGEYIFAFNFNPQDSFEQYGFDAASGDYRVVLDSDSASFGGFERNNDLILHSTVVENDRNQLYLYLPCRTVQVLKRI